ncbi:IS3 family transposase [Bacillus xiapuensis]
MHRFLNRNYLQLKNIRNKSFNYYNTKRIKQKLADMSPLQYRLYTSQLTA